jgi:hypothetical protein
MLLVSYQSTPSLSTCCNKNIVTNLEGTLKQRLVITIRKPSFSYFTAERWKPVHQKTGNLSHLIIIIIIKARPFKTGKETTVRMLIMRIGASTTSTTVIIKIVLVERAVEIVLVERAVEEGWKRGHIHSRCRQLRKKKQMYLRSQEENQVVGVMTTTTALVVPMTILSEGNSDMDPRDVHTLPTEREADTIRNGRWMMMLAMVLIMLTRTEGEKGEAAIIHQLDVTNAVGVILKVIVRTLVTGRSRPNIVVMMMLIIIIGNERWKRENLAIKDGGRDEANDQLRYHTGDVCILEEEKKDEQKEVDKALLGMRRGMA